jgi:hypothetical protein
VIAKNKDEYDKMEHYADIIQECQDDLGLRVSSFHNLGKSALAFHSLRAAQIAQKNNGNSNNDYNQYEEERFTDDNAYSEDFRDDYNKADRCTS